MTLLRKLELPLVLLLLTAGAAFLLKMCYLSLAINCLFGLAFLTGFYFYVRGRHDINIPVVLMVLVFAALQVDALGNYFQMYGRKFGPMQYDEFSHMAVQVLITPIIIWLVRRALDRLGHKVSLGIAALFAIMCSNRLVSITNTRAGPASSTVAVAVRGLALRSAISPKNSPGPSVAMTLSPFATRLLMRT